MILHQEYIGIEVSELGKVIIARSGGGPKIRLKIKGHPLVDIAGDGDAGTAEQEAFIIADGAIVRADQFFIVGDVIIAKLSVAADADFFIPFFGRGVSLSNGFFFFSVGFSLDPFFFGDLAFLIEDVLKFSVGPVGLDDQSKADHTDDGREPQSCHSNTSFSCCWALSIVLSDLKGRPNRLRRDDSGVTELLSLQGDSKYFEQAVRGRGSTVPFPFHCSGRAGAPQSHS